MNGRSIHNAVVRVLAGLHKNNKDYVELLGQPQTFAIGPRAEIADMPRQVARHMKLSSDADLMVIDINAGCRLAERASGQRSTQVLMQVRPSSLVPLSYLPWQALARFDMTLLARHTSCLIERPPTILSSTHDGCNLNNMALTVSAGTG